MRVSLLNTCGSQKDANGTWLRQHSLEILKEKGIDLYATDYTEEQLERGVLMERLKNFDLPWYIKDDLIDLLEKYPNLFEMSLDELEQLFKDKYLDAQLHSKRACAIKNEADAIRKYCNVKYATDY